MSFRTIFALLLAMTAASAGPKKPNFLFVIADDMTHRDIGCYGGQAHTPNIDRLATEGMRFTRCFQTAPMCSPTRHNIYTGLYPVKSGAYPNHTFAKDGTKSVAHYLKKLGYRVGLSGKTHISPKEVFPFEYSGSKNPDFEKIDTMFAECKKADTPFCLFACSNEPHTPWNKGDKSRYPVDKIKLPPYFVDTPETREGMSRYLAEITYYDWQVGELLKLLEKHGLAENTMVMVVSEQGASLPFGKWTCYDTGLQSAMVVRWPGKVKTGVTTEAMVEYVDVLPTFVQAAGGKPAKVLDGKSFVPVLTGKAQKHKDLVYGLMTTRGIINGSESFGIRSVRSGQFKYIWNFTPEIPFRNACLKSKEFQSWVKAAEAGDQDAAEKVRRYQNRPGEELYDVTKDRYEWTNLATDPKFAEIKSELRAHLDDWMKQQGDKGQPTEMEAKEHQGRSRSKNKAGAKKGKGKKKRKKE
jgi:N-sulfoglucosamine sulfohydrolase